MDPGVLPRPYFTFDKSHRSGPSIRDAEVEKLEQDSSSLYVPAPPIAPPELTKSGKALTKKERKAVSLALFWWSQAHTDPLGGKLKTRTAGPDWFDFPAPSEADLPKMYREYEALRLRNQLDPKRFYKKEEGEGKGIKGLPKYFAVSVLLELQYVIIQIVIFRSVLSLQRKHRSVGLAQIIFPKQLESGQLSMN